MAFPVDEKYIRETEVKLALKFPASFRNKMMIQNGGEIVICTARVPVPCD
jgi:hypothetical protein